MASARCYTKSGSVEKYESNLYSMGSFGIAVDITGPDSSGNYTVNPPKGYEDSNTPTEFGCTTDYGGIKKTFYFTYTTIQITVYYKVIGYNYNRHVAFDCIISGGTENDTSPNKEIINNILKNNSIYLLWKVVTADGPFGNYTTRITSVGSLILDTGANYVDGTKYYMSEQNAGDQSCDPSSGTYNGYTWETRVTGGI